ncbi:MAG: DUF6506 family protein [Eubacteriales bacterium]
MSKYALIMNVPGESPDTYSAVYEKDENYELYVGTGSMDMADELFKKLASEGFEHINLCGDFDDEITKRFIESGQGKIKISHASYLPEELEKLNKLPSLKEYGFISLTDGLDKMEKLELKSDECNSCIMLVTDMEMACLAANELFESGTAFIELCSWFDLEKTKKIINSINGKIPVGSCGIIM